MTGSFDGTVCVWERTGDTGEGRILFDKFKRKDGPGWMGRGGEVQPRWTTVNASHVATTSQRRLALC